MGRTVRSRPPRILTFNFHEPYLCLMARTGLPMDLGLYEQGILARTWQTSFRPKPANLHEIPEKTWRETLMSGGYDLVIAQNEMNALDALAAPCAKLLVCHNRRTFLNSTVRANEGDPLRAFLVLLERLAEAFQFIFISESKRDDYRIPGRVILPGIDVEEFGGYTGELARVLRVGNLMRIRNLMFDVPFQETACQGLPGRVIGINPDIADAEPAASYEALLDAYRQHRCLLHVTRQEYEDGYNLAMLEAMACGMPVVSLGNRTSPLTDGVDGFVSYDAVTLHRRLRELLNDRDLALGIGARGRETVASKFPVTRFIEQWREAIFEAVEKRPSVPAPRTRIKPPERRSVLMHYVASPVTTARYVEQAVQEKHDVLTVGFRLPEPVLKMWGFEQEPPPYPPARIPTALRCAYADILAQLPCGYQGDLYLFVDSGPHEIEPDINLLPMPRAAYLIDTHVSPELRLAMARHFDLVFLAQKAQVEPFRAAGIEYISWLPLACSPALHQVGDLERIYDVSYVGSLNAEEHGRRQALLEDLAGRFPNHRIGRFWPEEMARIYAQSRIVLNAAYNRDVNMRVFEAMASGALLITDEADGLEDLFQDGEHLVIYRRDADLPGLVARYLDDHAARERIARAGQELVLREHTYAHRVQTLMDTVSTHLMSVGRRPVLSASPEDAYYECPRRELLQHVPGRARRVLDVGCGAGAFGHTLKQERGVEEVAGIELVETAAARAREVLDQVLVGNLEEMDLPFPEGYFDCIVCGDVLEHLVDPAASLRKLARVLAPAGVIVISIPNVRFHDVVGMLSLGFWTYADAGILDQTHLRFFTRAELPGLIQRAGLEVAELTPLNMRDPERFPRNPDGSLTMGRLTIDEVSAEEYEDFLVYQYAVIACKPGLDRLAEAREALMQGNSEAALACAAEAVGVDAFERVAIMAKALARLGRLEQAEAAYREALSRREDPALAGEYGILLLGMNRIAEARPFLDRSLEADPGQDRVQGALGLALLHEKRYDEAFERFRTALESDYGNLSLMSAFITVAGTLDRLEDAEPLVRRFAEFYPGNMDLACDHAALLMKTGSAEAARHALEQARALDPENARVLHLLLEIETNNGTRS
jgi:spore maturation protein CgeB/ubiquinone/menaquinone biosynthesis C-methylase UbiE/Tfp pilus assembly protein PilF